VGHNYTQTNTTQHVSDTTMHKKHNTTCVGHNYAQKTQHNMCRSQLHCIHKNHNTTCVRHNYTQTNTAQHVSDTTTFYTQKPQHNMCRTQLYTNKHQ
jgi:hypothetical protein